MFMSTLHMCGCRMNKLFHFDVGFLSTCVCRTNKLFHFDVRFLSTCLCQLCTCVDVKRTNCFNRNGFSFDIFMSTLHMCGCQTNKLFHSTWIFFQHVYVDIAYMCGCWTNKLFHSTWIFFPCSFNMCSWDVKWMNLFCISILM